MLTGLWLPSKVGATSAWAPSLRVSGLSPSCFPNIGKRPGSRRGAGTFWEHYHSTLELHIGLFTPFLTLAFNVFPFLDISNGCFFVSFFFGSLRFLRSNLCCLLSKPGLRDRDASFLLSYLTASELPLSGGSALKGKHLSRICSVKMHLCLSTQAPVCPTRLCTCAVAVERV